MLCAGVAEDRRQAAGHLVEVWVEANDVAGKFRTESQQTPLKEPEDKLPSSSSKSRAEEPSPAVMITPKKPKSTMKRTLLDGIASSSTKKAKTSPPPSSPASTSPTGEAEGAPAGSARKRKFCDVCKAARTFNQRGAGCPYCLTATRQKCGHQSLQIVLSDETLVRDIAAASLALRAKQNPQGQGFKRLGTVGQERLLQTMSGKLDRILEHLGLA